jgi:hypothetical protein
MSNMSENTDASAKIPDKCPSCAEPLAVTRLSCGSCGTEVSGRFQPSPAAAVQPDDQDFVLMFVKTKGNLKRMERESGASYWTIRRRLDQVAERLEKTGESVKAEAGTKTNAEARQAILERLRGGQLSVAQADKLLQALGTQGTRTIPLRRFNVDIEPV